MKTVLYLVVVFLIGLLVLNSVQAVPSTNPADYFFYDDMNGGSMAASWGTLDLAGYSITNPYPGGNKSIQVNSSGNVNLDNILSSTNFTSAEYAQPHCMAWGQYDTQAPGSNTESGVLLNAWPTGIFNRNGAASSNNLSIINSTAYKTVGPWFEDVWYNVTVCFTSGYAGSGSTTAIALYNGVNYANSTMDRSPIGIVGLHNRLASSGISYFGPFRIWNYTQYGIAGPQAASAGQTLTIQVNDNVTGVGISGFCINATGTNTSQYLCNATGSTVSFNTTGTYNITAFNITSGNATPQWFNVTSSNYAFTTSDTLVLSAHQALLQIAASRLFLNTSISTFNGTNRLTTNTTSTGTLFIKAKNGTNNVKIDVAGNYSKNITCTVPSPLQTVSCDATGIHDNWYSFNATDVWNNVAVLNFSIIISNGTLGGVLYNQSTTNGSLNFSLLQGYTYFVQFSTPNGTYEYVNVSLPANASYHRYEFDVLPAPSIDITIRDADTNVLILENVTVQLINNITGQTNYTIDGGFFSGEITVGTYTIKLESVNYSQSVYTVTVNAGSVYFLTAYLQFAPETVVMQFVDSISSSVVLPDTAVSQERIVNGSWQVISSKVTDITGRTSFRYADDTAYRFSAIKTGYDSKLFTLDPILFSSYTISMVRDTALDFDEDFQSVYVGYSPYIYYNDQQNQMNITFSSPLGTFTSYEYIVRYPGGSKNGSGTNVVGQTYTIDFNITGASITDRVNITLTYDTSIGPQRSYNYSNGIITSPGNTTFIANQGNTYGLGLLERLIIGTLIIIIVAGLITVGAGPLWGAGMGLFIMGIWLKIGFWPWWAAGLSFLVGFALLSGRTD